MAGMAVLFPSGTPAGEFQGEGMTGRGPPDVGDERSIAQLRDVVNKNSAQLRD